MAFGIDSIKEGLRRLTSGKDDKRALQKLYTGALGSLKSRKRDLASREMRGKQLKDTIRLRESNQQVTLKDRTLLKENTRVVSKIKSDIAGLERNIKKISMQLRAL